jgi:S-adenosylmethionine:tRNA ribosyltransferase-isomerase
MLTHVSPFSFDLPTSLLAKEPPELRGIARDAVKLMVVSRRTGEIQHTNFRKLSKFLKPGDLLVFNSSRTLPASITGYDSITGSRIEVRLAEHLPDNSWLALLVCNETKPFACRLKEGMKIDFDLGLSSFVLRRNEKIPRLWKVKFSKSETELMNLLYQIGKPIRYEYTSTQLNLDYYQNVYSTEPGSTEMPSAGRAFTWRMLFELKRRGIRMTHIVLHATLSSYLDDNLDSRHPVSEEEYYISQQAANEVNHAHKRGNRVIAIGTTVVRTLESVVDETKGVVNCGHGYTQLQITPNYRPKVVDGLLTGLHEPKASHLDLLSAFLTPQRIRLAYEEAIKLRYLWHEFGDLNLIL